MKDTKLGKLLETLGPGLLYAGAAIGVSHLVQSTRAGAEYGFTLVWAVIIANALKYPFFEYGPRYAASTGHSLLEGYKKLGKWAIILVIIMTISTMFTIQAAVTVVTAGLANQLTGIELPDAVWSGILLVICLGVLGFGHYKVLDKLMKVIIITLSITTIVALFSAIFSNAPKPTDGYFAAFNWNNLADITFLIALMGWMPGPLDISIWHSVWTLAKKREVGHLPTLKEAQLDFKIGYWGTAGLAICFLSLGALIMYTSGIELASSGSAFAGQLIDMYTSSIGSWAYYVIIIAAFTTMFSTTLTCLDAFPRVLRTATQIMIPKAPQDEGNHSIYWAWIIIVASGTLVILTFMIDNMKDMVQIATIISFLTAPIIAILNFMVVSDTSMPEAARPKMLMRIISWVGIVYLLGFCGLYLMYQV